MGLLQELVLRLRADSADYQKGLNRAKKDTKTFGSETQKVTREVQRAFGALGLAISGVAFTGFVKRSLDAVDALAKTADKLGVTTQALAGLRLAAETTGVGASKLDMALQRMTRRLSEAAQGSGEAKGAIQELGLDASRLASLSPDQAFVEIAGAMEKVTNQSDRVRLAFKFFDSEGVALVNTLNLGEEGLAGMAEEAQRLGLAIDRDAARKVEAANDAITKLHGSFTGFGFTLVSEIAPSLEILAKELTNVGTESEQTAPLVTALSKSFETLTISVLTIENLFGGLGDSIGATAAAISFILEGEFEKAANVGNMAADDLEARFVRLGNTIRDIDLFGLNDQAPAATVNTETTTTLGGVSTQAPLGDLGGANFVGPGLWEFKAQQEAEAQSAALEAQIEFNNQRFESEIAAAEMLQDTWLTAIDTRVAAEQRGMQMILDMERRTADLRENQAQHTASAIMNFTNALYQFSGSKSKKLFELNKAAGIANAIIDTYGAANKALNHPPGPPTTIPIAAAVVAQGLANVAAISSQTFEGGGTRPAAGGFGGGTPDSPIVTDSALPEIEPVPESKTIQINIHGNVVDHDKFAREVIPSLAKAINDGESLELA